MYTLGGEPQVERFELIVVPLRSQSGLLRVPLVDEWLELQLALREVPAAAHRRAFFAALGELCTTIRARLPQLHWYFLHKPPGLKLRFRVGAPDVELLDTILSAVANWNFSWLETSALGSFFDQAELLAFPYRTDVERFLTHAADCHVLQAKDASEVLETDWADVLVMLLERIGLDTWLAYEALSRLGRLRSTDVARGPQSGEPLCDPHILLATDLPRFSPGFEASVSLLQGLNLLFNIWGVSSAAQSRILALACDRTRPELLALHP